MTPAAVEEIEERRLEAEELVLRAPLAAALDVGVSKTVCLAARRDPVLDLHPERPLRVLGIGQQTAPSVASGKGGDFDTCARAIRIALEEAGAMAGAPIRRVVASYAGPGISSQIIRSVVRVRSRTVSSRDVDNVIAAAMQSAPTPQLSILHLEPLRYYVDDGEALADPHGYHGRRLALEACVVTAPTGAINALRSCIAHAGADVDEIIAAPKAAALAVLTPDERAQGALLVDLGAGAMGLAAVVGDGLVHCETVPVGGVRLTRDLADKLQTTFAAAERVKLNFSAVTSACDPREAVPTPKLGSDGRLEASTTLRGVIADTITPRLYEMLLTARERLGRAGFSGANALERAVLVGGGAAIPGVRDLAVEALGMPVRLGRPFELCGFDHGEVGPAYAASAGLLRHRLDTITLEDDQYAQPALARLGRFMRNAARSAWNWLRDNF